ncbi:Pre-mRNA-processing ATP-dependent RNA helicase PRP5 [Scheffersomyces coipomensis]|uniref:Pre-mRNA-processing ATP-dependent RNA helicase PRP5 n=1 Tax=Scheffersomyces coipomensis TaxID=1788519 RepID=UPI00315CDF56
MMAMVSDETSHSSFESKKPNDEGQTSLNNQSTNISGNEELSKAEKLRRRRERLALWKETKKQESQEAEEPANGEGSLSKIEVWKRRKALEKEQQSSQTSKPASVEKSTLKISTIKKGKILPKKVAKRALFDDEVPEEDSGLKFKKPDLNLDIDSMDYYSTKNDNETDELDDFIKSLEGNDNVKVAPVTNQAQIINDQEDIANDIENEENEDDDEEVEDEEEAQQRLLSSKLLKLQNKEKELGAIDFSNENVKSFRKSFYTEPFEIKNLSTEDVEAIRFDFDGIRVHGMNIPKPILKWSHLALSSVYMDIIENKLGYSGPTSIQAQALPTIMSGRDLIGVAKTGSGKTLSFVLPMLRHVQDQESLKKDDGPIAVILTPTRELALQIFKEVGNFLKKIDLRACCCYGGAPIENQIAELKKGVEIIVGTPGRVIDLLAANSGRVTNLKRVTYLVLDEADRMFDMGFEPQVSKIFTQVRPDRQTVLFSATFPRKMELLAKKILQNPIEIIVGGISIVAPEVTQKAYLFEGEEKEVADVKFTKLIDDLKEFQEKDPQGKVLIFVEKQSYADELLVKLLAEEIPCLAIHGGKDQLDRKHAIKDFSSKTSGVNILIATSIAARGLDVKGLNLVINYEAPNHMEDYVHRVGRTGRAGAKGTAITYVSSSQERCITDLVKAMRLSKVAEESIPSRMVEISNEFLKKVTKGKVKYNFGFGGKGLEKLQQIRENARDIQRKEFNVEDQTHSSTSKDNDSSNASPAPDVHIDEGKLPDFTIIKGGAPETAGPDRGNFHSRITINDLPQKARWTVVNRDSLPKIIEATGASITSKGQYYPPGTKVPEPTIKNGKEIPAPAKLYLLVEGLTEQSVHEANKLLRQKMIEGLEIAAKEESKLPTGKY